MTQTMELARLDDQGLLDVSVMPPGSRFYVGPPPGGTTPGTVLTVQSDGSVAYSSPPGDTGSVTVTDNGDGTVTLAGPGLNALLRTIAGGDEAYAAAGDLYTAEQEIGANTAAITATQSSIDATQAQQTQLMATAATIDDLTVTGRLVGRWSGGTWVQTSTAGMGGHASTLWVAPYACQVVACEIMTETQSIPADASNYATFQLQRASGGAMTSMVSKTTAQQAITARTGWNLDGATWNTNAAVLAKSDGLTVLVQLAGTVQLTFPLAVTCTVTPL